MKSCKIVRACFIVPLVLLLCYFLVFIIGSYQNGENISVWIPDGGTWYCEALQMELSFEYGEYSYVIIEGEEIKCKCYNNRGARDISLVIMEEDLAGYQLGDTYFWASYVDLNDECYVVKECSTGEVYTFCRIDKQ